MQAQAQTQTSTVAKKRAYNPDYYQANKARIRAHQTRYSRDYGKRKEVRAKRNAARRERRLRDPQYRLQDNVRNNLAYTVKFRSSRTWTAALLGCTIGEFVAYIESQFRPGMSWENRGSAWEFDHILPLAAFDLTDPAQLAKAVHYSNIQVLTSAENMAKGARIQATTTRH